MNRRAFLLGGGLIGVTSATVASILKASQPEGSVAICKDSHQPIQSYIDRPALGISDGKDAFRSLVPCKNCGVLFALTPPKKP